MAKKTRSEARTRRKAKRDDCTIPPPIEAKDLSELVFPRDESEVGKIASYVEWQAKDEQVQHAEKVSEEQVMGTKYEGWDVITDKGRWWVITPPTNLYSQRLMPSLDYTLSFHIGVMARVAERDGGKPDIHPMEQAIIADAWRRWEQAGDVLAEAQEAEDFQSVGMRCRECLIVMVRTMAKPEMVPAGTDAPKLADVIHWCGLIADHIAHGPSSRHVRGYLKAISKSAWELVNWLTHAQNATLGDGVFAHDATRHVMAAFGAAVFRHVRGIPDRCVSCGSYKIGLWSPEEGTPERPRCGSCGWIKPNP